MFKKMSNEDFYALLVLVAILACVFKDQISDFLSNLFNTDNFTADSDDTTDAPTPSSFGTAQWIMVSMIGVVFLTQIISMFVLKKKSM